MDVTITLAPMLCTTCSIVYAIPSSTLERVKKSGDEFYCPAGHKQRFHIGETVEQKLAKSEEYNRNARHRIEEITEDRAIILNKLEALQKKHRKLLKEKS